MRDGRHVQRKLDKKAKSGGNNNSVHDLVFATDTGRLILKGEAVHSTEIFGVDEARIVRI